MLSSPQNLHYVKSDARISAIVAICALTLTTITPHLVPHGVVGLTGDYWRLTGEVRYDDRMRVSRKPLIDEPTGIPHHVRNRHSRNQARSTLEPRLVLRNMPRPLVGTFADAAAWCFPWNVFSYPGHYRGLLAVLGRSVSLSSICGWKQRDRPAPWAAAVLSAYIRRRCAVGLELADRLDAYARDVEFGPKRRPPPKAPEV